MLLTPSARDATVDLVGADLEALFKEARRRRRRRWSARLLVGAVLLSGAAAVAAVTISGAGSSVTGAAATAGVLPNGPLATLHVAGPLAVAPDGALYVANVVVGPFPQPGGEGVLVRLPDGRFRVVAGNGKTGFSGDGGSAVRAELSDISDLVFAPNGTLYIADAGRVRVVGRNGVIRTIAGDGKPLQPIANGTPAVSAALGSTHAIRAGDSPLSIALGPSGDLYISTRQQILRLTATGRLDTVRAVITSGPGEGALRGIGSIAIDARGNIDASSLDTGWSLWQVARNGVARYVGFARRSGGDYSILQPGPDGTIYAGTNETIRRVESQRLVPIFTGPPRPLRGQIFPVTYFVFSPSGTIYADDVPGNEGFEVHQQLLSVSNHRTSLLWQENNATPK